MNDLDFTLEEYLCQFLDLVDNKDLGIGACKSVGFVINNRFIHIDITELSAEEFTDKLIESDNLK